jgi:hypothetical protein
MARPKKERIAFNAKPEAELMRRFEAYCADKGQSKTTAFERILGSYLDEYEKTLKVKKEVKG